MGWPRPIYYSITERGSTPHLVFITAGGVFALHALFINDVGASAYYILFITERVWLLSNVSFIAGGK